MAVPTTVTMKDISGTYVLNKTLSDPVQNMLKMQNVSFLVRQAAQFSSITATLTQSTDEEGKVHLEQKEVSTGGIRNTEERVLDGEWGEKENRIWGKVKGMSRYVKLDEVEDAFLKEGWSRDCFDGEVIESSVESLTDTWTAQQIWGFAEVNSEKKYVRRCVGKKGDQVERIRLIYDWKA